jgi:hypothetical protein
MNLELRGVDVENVVDVEEQRIVGAHFASFRRVSS